MSRSTKLLPIVKQFIATAQAYFSDGSLANESGSLVIYVGDTVIASWPASRTLDGPIEIHPLQTLGAPPSDYFDTDAEEVVHVANGDQPLA